MHLLQSWVLAEHVRMHTSCSDQLPAPAACCLPPATCSTPAAELEAAARQLLACCQAGLPSPVSYNAVMTQEWLMLVPRRQEACGNIAVK